MNQKQAEAYIRKIGLSVVVRDGEFRVSYPLAFYTGQGMTRAEAAERAEATAHYTDCRNDAVATAACMAAAFKLYPVAA